MITISARQAEGLLRLDRMLHPAGGKGVIARDRDNAWYLSDTVWIRMPQPCPGMDGTRILPWQTVTQAARSHGRRSFIRLDDPDRWVTGGTTPPDLPAGWFAPLTDPDDGAPRMRRPDPTLTDTLADILSLDVEHGAVSMVPLKGGRHGRPALLLLPLGMLRGLASAVILEDALPDATMLTEWGLDRATLHTLTRAGILTDSQLASHSVHSLLNVFGERRGLRFGPATLARVETACISHGLMLRCEPLTETDMRRLYLRADGRPYKGHPTLPHDPATGLPQGM